jgi:hypothetical protein
MQYTLYTTLESVSSLKPNVVSSLKPTHTLSQRLIAHSLSLCDTDSKPVITARRLDGLDHQVSLLCFLDNHFI